VPCQNVQFGDPGVDKAKTRHVWQTFAKISGIGPGFENEARSRAQRGGASRRGNASVKM